MYIVFYERDCRIINIMSMQNYSWTNWDKNKKANRLSKSVSFHFLEVPDGIEPP